jgi:hypothetical protein
MRRLRGAKDKEVLRFIEEVKETRIPSSHLVHQFDDLLENLVQIERGRDRLADLVKNAKLLACEVKSLLDVFE